MTLPETYADDARRHAAQKRLRLQSLRQAIRAGRYRISASTLARSILRRIVGPRHAGGESHADQ